MPACPGTLFLCFLRPSLTLKPRLAQKTPCSFSHCVGSLQIHSSVPAAGSQVLGRHELQYPAREDISPAFIHKRSKDSLESKHQGERKEGHKFKTSLDFKATLSQNAKNNKQMHTRKRTCVRIMMERGRWNQLPLQESGGVSSLLPPPPTHDFETSGHRILQHTELFGKLQVVIFRQTLFFPVA